MALTVRQAVSSICARSGISGACVLGAGAFRTDNFRAQPLPAGAIRKKGGALVTAQIWIALAVGTAAVVEDVARRQISNWIPCAAFAGGLGLQTWLHGWQGLGSALAGAAAGFGVFLLLYLLGGMGGGDVKLMAGFGALLGVWKVLEAALWTAGCGGVFAVLYLAARWLHGRLPRGRLPRGRWLTKNREPADGNRADSIPYAPAIAAGVWLSLVPKG